MSQISSIIPFWPSFLVLIAVVAGHLYRQNWKEEGPRWKAWLYGVIAGFSLLALAFVPFEMRSN